MSSLFYRDLKSPPWIAQYSANELIVGPPTTDQFEQGYHTYFDDLSAGAGITCLGHSNEAIKEAMAEQISTMPYAHAMNWSHQPAEELAAELIRLTVRGNPNSKFNGGRVMFLNSGAEAVEAACKLAMQVGYEQDKTQPSFYGRKYSYHGNTMFTLALGDHPKKKLYLFVNSIDVDRFPAYRASLYDGGYVSDLADLNRWLVKRYDSEEHPIVVIEPIGGTTIGIEPSTTEYLTELSIMCKKNNAILIYDEVLCGNYRTGELFAYQYYDALEPDIICLGKGLTGGYFPLSAVIVCGSLVRIIESGSGKLWHSTTNQNHPIGCAAGIAALKEYEKIKDRLPDFGKQVQELAIEQLSKCGCEIVGVGSLLGVRLDPNQNGLHALIRKQALCNGVVVYTDGQTMDGKGNMVLLAPPYSYLEDMDHLNNALFRLALAIQSAETVRAAKLMTSSV